MDFFSEQILKKKLSSKDMALKLITIIATIFLTVMIFIFSMVYAPVGVILAIGMVFLGYYLTSNFNAEYEYTVTNGEFDVDKIIAKRKRTHLLTVKASSFEAFGRVDENEEILSENDKITFLVSDGESKNEYYADFRHEIHGESRIIFSPNENMLKCLKKFMPKELR